MCKELIPFDAYSKEQHDNRRDDLHHDPTLNLVAEAFEEQVDTVLREMERLSCMLAGNGFPQGAMQLDSGPRTAFEKLAPWINHRVVAKLHERL